MVGSKHHYHGRQYETNDIAFESDDYCSTRPGLIDSIVGQQYPT